MASINQTDELFSRHGSPGRPGADSEEDEPLSTLMTWVSAFGFVTIINMSSVMGILFFPLMNRSFYTIVMRTMIGLAIGSLSGSALFHLIPAAFGLDALEQKEGAPPYINIALIVWIAAWTVMMLECGIKIGVKMRARSRKPKIQVEETALKITDSLSLIEEKDENEEEKDSVFSPSMGNGLVVKGSMTELDNGGNNGSLSRENLPIHRSTLSLSKMVAEGRSDLDDDEPGRIKTVAWIIIIGDSLHNFIDGVSIGTAFVKSFHTGAIISVAIMCEEFPHELGDFAILINSGLSVKKALLFNFMSALTCYLGMALGIVLGEISWDSYIFAFAAGIFLYVALADMVPEVTSLTEEVSDISPASAIKVLINHNLGILAGVIILYVLALYQP